MDKQKLNQLCVNICVVCGKSIPKRRRYVIDSSTPKRKAVKALMLRYGGVNVKRGIICNTCYEKLKTLHKKCSAFYKQCQRNIMKNQPKKIIRMVSSRTVLSAQSMASASSAGLPDKSILSPLASFPAQSNSTASLPVGLPAQSVLSSPAKLPIQLKIASSTTAMSSEATAPSPTSLSTQSRAIFESSPSVLSVKSATSLSTDLPAKSKAIVSSPATLTAKATLSSSKDLPAQPKATASSLAGLPAKATTSSTSCLPAQPRADTSSLAVLLAKPVSTAESPARLLVQPKRIVSSPTGSPARRKKKLPSTTASSVQKNKTVTSQVASLRLAKALKSVSKKQSKTSEKFSQTCTTEEVLNNTEMNTESDTHESMDFQMTQCRPKAEGRQKKAKDPNRPKRPTSAYFFFLADCREVAKREGRSVSKIAEFTKECSAKWREMNEKAKEPFEEKAGFDKERYDREMKLYGGPGSKKASRDPTQPKRPLSGYFLFLADFRAKMAGSNMEHKEILKLAGKEWSELTMEEKTPYEKQSQEEQRKYEIAMAEWRRSGGGGGAQMMSSNGANAPIEIDDDDEEEYEEDE